MGKRFSKIDGADFALMVLAAADNLQRRVEEVNALNVFPVPDGDTGTNMNLTWKSGAAEVRKLGDAPLGKVAQTLAKGLLMGARGNSGVILSQLFRGFAKAVERCEEMDAFQLSAALQSGVDTAYRAVVRPVEGTILTVSREAARYAVAQARYAQSVTELMRDTLQKAKEALAKTPEQLPVLKQVGVVDAGGQGLVYVYEGFMQALSGEKLRDDVLAEEQKSGEPAPAVPALSAGERAQARLRTEDIANFYDMEFFIRLGNPYRKFKEDALRQELERYGDSIIVIADDSIVKVHVHASMPGHVLNAAVAWGELTQIHILNMREQHRELVAGDGVAVAEAEERETKPYGFVAVSLGAGLADIFSSLGVDCVLQGGQTMNPSTEDLLQAIAAVPAKTVFVLPNNSNIVLAAQQARQIADKHVVVVPTKTIPQGFAAMIAFHETESAEWNEQRMSAAAQQVVTGQLTYAVRASSMDGIEIAQGDYLGLVEQRIVAAAADLLEVGRSVVREMAASGGGEMMTIYAGEDARAEDTEALLDYVQRDFPELDVEVHPGRQPLYAYLFSME